jgi:hypothetical protein
MFQHQVKPLLDDGWATIPVKRMLKNDDVMLDQQLLFSLDINVKVGVAFVQVIDGYALQVGAVPQQNRVNPGLTQERMRELD